MPFDGTLKENGVNVSSKEEAWRNLYHHSWLPPEWGDMLHPTEHDAQAAVQKSMASPHDSVWWGKTTWVWKSDITRVEQVRVI